MAYKHLTKDERTTISAFHKAGWTQTQIANEMGLNQGTISRELSRNSVSCCTTEGICRSTYNPTTAQKQTKERRIKANKDQVTKIVRGSRLWKHIVEKMTVDNWSPEQIAGRIKVDWEKFAQPWFTRLIRLTTTT
jgi:transposase, IS30 family